MLEEFPPHPRTRKGRFSGDHNKTTGSYRVRPVTIANSGCFLRASIKRVSKKEEVELFVCVWCVCVCAYDSSKTRTLLVGLIYSARQLETCQHSSHGNSLCTYSSSWFRVFSFPMLYIHGLRGWPNSEHSSHLAANHRTTYDQTLSYRAKPTMKLPSSQLVNHILLEPRATSTWKEEPNRPSKPSNGRTSSYVLEKTRSSKASLTCVNLRKKKHSEIHLE